MQAAAQTESDSQRLGTALYLIEAMLKEIGSASSVKALKDAEPMQRARKFLQSQMGQ